MTDRAIVTMEGKWETAPKLLNGTGLNDLEWPLTKISRSWYHSTSNNSKMVADRAIFTIFFFLYACHEPSLVSHKTASSSAECSRDKPPYSFVTGQDSTMWDIIWISPQGHRSVSVRRHFFLQALQCPCSVWKRFSKDHCCQGGRNPVAGLWGRTLGEWADFQLCLHRLLMSTGCKSSHSSFLDVSRSNGGLRISGWIRQLSCLTIFSTSLLLAAFLRRAGGSLLESTGSHGRGVERRVPEMRCMVEFNCTSTRLVWAERDQTR